MKKMLSLLLALCMLLSALPAALAEASAEALAEVSAEASAEEPVESLAVEAAPTEIGVAEETLEIISNDEVLATKLAVTPNKKELGVNAELTLTAKLTPENATGTVTWTIVSGDKFVKLESLNNTTARVTGLSAGKATIQASIKGKKKTLTAKSVITVVDNSAAKGIKLNAKKLSLDVSQQEGKQVKAILTPDTADRSRITWSVKPREGVVRLVDDGLGTVQVIPEGIGKATVTATVPTAQTSKSASLAVTVSDNSAPTGVKISGPKSADISEEFVVVATLQPATAKAAEGVVTWTYNSNVLVLTQEELSGGQVKATFTASQAAKNTPITASVRTAKGVKKDSLKVTVVDKSAPTGIAVSPTKYTADIAADDSIFSITANLKPEGAKGDIAWSVDGQYLEKINEEFDEEKGAATIWLLPLKVVKSTKVTATVQVAGKPKSASTTVTIKDTSAPTDIAVSPTTVKLDMGNADDSAEVKATLTPANAKGEIKWKITKGSGVVELLESESDEHSSTFAIVPLMKGEAEITFSVDGLKKTAKVSVTVADMSAPTKLTLNTTKMALKVNEDGEGEGQLLKATVTFNSGYSLEGSDLEFICESSNPDVAEPEETDLGEWTIVPYQEGKATITVKIGNLSRTCEVTVQKVATPEPEPEPVPGLMPDRVLIIDPPSYMTVGERWRVEVELERDDGQEAQSELTFTSSDPSVLVEDANEHGRMRALKVGTATVTVTAENGKSASYTMKVVDFGLDLESFLLRNGSSRSLADQVLYGSDEVRAAAQPLSWSCSDTSVATVDDTGLVTGMGKGTAVITVTAASGQSARCKVTVISALERLEADGPIELEVGDEVYLWEYVRPIPEGTSLDEITSANWSSSNKKIAVVTSDGVLTALKSGKVYMKLHAKVDTKSMSLKIQCIVN